MACKPKPAKTLQLDGKVFKLNSTHKKKSNANEDVKKLRRKGYYARVLNPGYEYQVYKHKK